MSFALFLPTRCVSLELESGILVAIILLMLFNKENKPMVFLNDSERLISTVGPLSMLPMLLASLGAVFTAAGVGDVVAGIVGKIIPEGM